MYVAIERVVCSRYPRMVILPAVCRNTARVTERYLYRAAGRTNQAARDAVVTVFRRYDMVNIDNEPKTTYQSIAHGREYPIGQ